MKKIWLILTACALLAAAACSREAVPETAQTETKTESVQTTLPTTEAESTTELPETTSESHTGSASAGTTFSVPSPQSIPHSTTTLPTASAQTPVGAIPFEARYIRIDGFTEEKNDPRTVVLDSRAALDAYLENLTGLFYDRTLPKKLSDQTQKYTDDWFRTGRLLGVTMLEPSGSIEHKVQRVERTADGVTIAIDRIRPQVGTADMAPWQILVEVADTTLRSGDRVTPDIRDADGD